MKLRKQFLTLLRVFVSIVLIIQLSGCGTILYPERRGQKTGRIDPGVAILDGLGLLLFIIPGVIAFAVDFTTGAIYLPGGSRRSSVMTEAENVMVVRVNPAELNEKTIKEIVGKETGGSARLVLSDAEVYVLDGLDNIGTRLTELSKSGYRKD